MGATFGNSISVNGAVSAYNSSFVANAGAGYAGYQWHNEGATRWWLYNQGDADDDLKLSAYDNSGGFIGNPLTIKRNTGNVLIKKTSDSGEALQVEGTVLATGGEGIRSYKDGADVISSNFYFANAANNRAYNWQLNADGSAADFWGYAPSFGWNRRMSIGVNGNIGIEGVSTPNAPLQFANTVKNKKLVLWEDVNNDHQFLGFGVNGGLLRYQVGVAQDHAFYAATSSTSSSELMRIKGDKNLEVQGSASLGLGINSARIKLTNNQSGVFTNDFLIQGQGGSTYLGNYQNFPLSLSTNNISRLFITGAGNVLVGSTIDNGLAKLQTPSLIVGNNALYSDGTNVGIGTTAIVGGAKLEIATNNTQFPVGIRIQESTHSTSRRATINLGNYQLISDVNANGFRDFGIYNNITTAVPFTVGYNGNVSVSGRITSARNNETDYNTPTFSIESSSNASGFGAGITDAGAYIQSYASKPLRINPATNNTQINPYGGNVLIGNPVDNGLAKLQTPNISLGVNQWNYSSEGNQRLYYEGAGSTFFKVPDDRGNIFRFGEKDLVRIYGGTTAGTRVYIHPTDTAKDMSFTFEPAIGSALSSSNRSTGFYRNSNSNFTIFDYNGTNYYDWVKTVASTNQLQLANNIFSNYGGNTGFGTASPTQKVDIAGGLKATKGIFGTTGGTAYALNVSETNNSDVAAAIENRSTTGFGVAINSYANNNNYILNLNGSNGSSRVWFGSNGNTGFGTTSPNCKIEIGGANGGVAFRVKRDDTNVFDIYQGGGATYLDASATGGQLAFRTQGAERMRIRENGNVLIGSSTDNGLAKLQASSLIIGSSLYSDGITVGIGTASPHASALYEAVSTTKAAIPFPEMTESQRIGIPTPKKGMHVYQNTAPEGVWVYKSTGWVFAY